LLSAHLTQRLRDQWLGNQVKLPAGCQHFSLSRPCLYSVKPTQTLTPSSFRIRCHSLINIFNPVFTHLYAGVPMNPSFGHPFAGLAFNLANIGPLSGPSIDSVTLAVPDAAIMLASNWSYWGKCEDVSGLKTHWSGVSMSSAEGGLTLKLTSRTTISDPRTLEAEGYILQLGLGCRKH
jgi:hypothetical protein